MPLFHIHGLAVNVLASALSGTSLYATTGFAGGEGFFDALRKASTPGPSPTWYSAVPTMHQDILHFAEEYRASHGGAAPAHRLRFARNCSAALLPSIGRRMEDVLGVQVICTYAMTESMPIASNRGDGAFGSKGAGCDPAAPLRSAGSRGPEILVMRDPEYNRNLEVCAPGVHMRGASAPRAATSSTAT